jgi:outer membrane protein
MNSAQSYPTSTRRIRNGGARHRNQSSPKKVHRHVVQLRLGEILVGDAKLENGNGRRAEQHVHRARQAISYLAWRMKTKSWLLTAALLAPAMLPAGLFAQDTPPAPGVVWQPRGAHALQEESAAKPHGQIGLAPGATYTLAELIDLAEQHNPETRVAWEEAKSKADELGIARSSLYPTLTAVALAVSLRTATLIDEYYHRQTEGIFEPVLRVEYLVFDVGGRSGEIDVAKANLLASNLAFNDTHRRIIYQVAEAYYRLLNAQGQRQAAEFSLENARAVEQDAEARLENGLATKPDELEATAARAQADFDLQAAIGAVDIARGDLATALGVDPGTVFAVQGIDQLKLPSSIADSVDQEIDRAFSQRPDLLLQLARLRAANASIKQVRSEYFPTLSFSGDGGMVRAYGQQDLLPGSYAAGETWTAQFELRWNLFDGARREYRMAQANHDKKAAQAQIDALRDQIADQVWTAYTNMRTAFRQQQAAASLLTASQESYQAAHESYGYGVRNLLDVVSAQKTLAQARSEDVAARTQLLLTVTGLAFQTADFIQTQHWSPAP